MKRALLIGINYIGSPCELNGCVNDVMNIKDLLINSFNYKAENIVMLDDAGKNPLKPTKVNILKYIDQVVSKTEKGDTLFMHYSGHGSQVDDLNGDEKTNIEAPNQDDVLCPCDYASYEGSEGFILDDYLKANIVNKLPKGAKLRAIFDCCYSGTMLDLPFIYRNGVFTQIEKLCANTDDCITISGCMDNQTSSDAFINRKYSGALTWALLKVLNNANKVPTTWNLLLTVAQHYLAADEYTQIPVLCTGNKKLMDTRIDL